MKLSHKSLSKFGTNPETDWKIILVSAIILTLIIISSNIYIFIKIDKGEIFVIERLETNEVEVLDIVKLRETVSYYQHKATEFERIKGIKTPSADPSL